MVDYLLSNAYLRLPREETGHAVTGISGSRFYSMKSEEGAYEAFTTALHSGRVSITHKLGRS